MSSVVKKQMPKMTEMTKRSGGGGGGDCLSDYTSDAIKTKLTFGGGGGGGIASSLQKTNVRFDDIDAGIRTMNCSN